MTSRVLPVDEWDRLDGTLLASVWRSLKPDHAEVIVVEQGGEIVACVALISMLHAECCEITGGPGVARALWRGLRERVHAAGGQAVWAAAVEEPMQRLLTRHGAPIPGDHCLLRV